ncbi:MAG: DUF3300 domain-containing protein [Woeseiaceae bacterium]|nr:DUF3300 domain-containing protein [Woeseiaceae bacterium]
MKVLEFRQFAALRPLVGLLLALPLAAAAQVPVDDEGRPYSEYSTARADEALGDEDIPLRSAAELEELVGPIALYPDDLLAIVLPAATYPLQIVQAGRFLEALENDPSLEPDENWDDSVVALTNYPEVVELMNDDLDWTWRLGEAVIAQQQDVIAAVESFRDRAYAAGNLESDAHQRVSHSDEGIIEIVPLEDDVIYVPYYEPAEVVVYQPRRVYYYYPRPYPVYYYPYPSHYHFDRGYFWGVTTAFTIGWYTDHLHVFHHSYHGHPYYGHHYWDRWWYRRPSLSVYNTIYVHNHVHRSRDYYRSGDYWESRQHRRLRQGDGRITRNRYYPGNGGDSDRLTSSRRTDAVARFDSGTRRQFSDRRGEQDRRGAARPDDHRNVSRSGNRRDVVRSDDRRSSAREPNRSSHSTARRDVDHEIRFRERPARSGRDQRRDDNRAIRFRERPAAVPGREQRHDTDRVRHALSDSNHNRAQRTERAAPRGRSTGDRERYVSAERRPQAVERRPATAERARSGAVERSRSHTVRAPERSRPARQERVYRAEQGNRSRPAEVRQPRSNAKVVRTSRSRPDSSGTRRAGNKASRSDDRRGPERRPRARDRD